MGGADENAETRDKLPAIGQPTGTLKQRASKLFNERHGLSVSFCLGFLARSRLTISNLREEDEIPEMVVQSYTICNFREVGGSAKRSINQPTSARARATRSV